MPSGVSQGSAWPAGAVTATGSKATLAKSGMWLMTYLTIFDGAARPLIMIRMLVARDARHLVRSVILQRGLARKVRDPDHPAEPGLRSVLPGRHQSVGPIEGAGQDLDAGAIDAAEAQGRAAVLAEVALGDR